MAQPLPASHLDEFPQRIAADLSSSCRCAAAATQTDARTTEFVGRHLELISRVADARAARAWCLFQQGRTDGQLASRFASPRHSSVLPPRFAPTSAEFSVWSAHFSSRRAGLHRVYAKLPRPSASNATAAIESAHRAAHRLIVSAKTSAVATDSTVGSAHSTQSLGDNPTSSSSPLNR